MIVVTSPDSTPESGASRPTSASAKQVRLRKIFEHIAAKTPATGEDFDYILDLLGQCVAGEPGSVNYVRAYVETLQKKYPSLTKIPYASFCRHLHHRYTRCAA